MKQKDLELFLESLELPSEFSPSLEQYPTPAPIAAAFLWALHMRGVLHEKTIADLGCGSGVLGIGALFLGAKKVHFVDTDAEALLITQKNLVHLSETQDQTFDFSLHHQEVSSFSESVDLVLQNPPFGVQKEHADRSFLETAFLISPLIYSFHKIESGTFLSTFAQEHHFLASLFQSVSFPLKQTMKHHTQRVYTVDVGIWEFRKEE